MEYILEVLMRLSQCEIQTVESTSPTQTSFTEKIDGVHSESVCETVQCETLLSLSACEI